MKSKRILSIFLLLSILMSTISYGYEEIDKNELSTDLLKNNSVLEKLDLSVANMNISIYKADIDSKSMKNTIEYLSDIGYSPSGTTLAGMMYVQNIVPKQVRYGMFALKGNQEITKISLSNAARQMATGVINSKDSFELNTNKYNFYKSEYNSAKLKYELGIISKTDLLKSEVTFLESETALNISKRKLEDSYLNLNKLIGYELDRTYDIKREDKLIAEIGLPEDHLNFALKNRFEIKDLNEQIMIQDAIIDHYDYGDFLGFYPNYKATKDAEIKKKTLELDLIIMKQTITEEIYKAVSNINITENQIVQLKNTIDMQTNNYNRYLAQVAQGFITESAIKELEFVISGLKTNLDILVYSYNTKRYELFNATQIGPAYGGGM